VRLSTVFTISAKRPPAPLGSLTAIWTTTPFTSTTYRRETLPSFRRMSQAAVLCPATDGTLGTLRTSSTSFAEVCSRVSLRSSDSLAVSPLWSIQKLMLRPLSAESPTPTRPAVSNLCSVKPLGMAIERVAPSTVTEYAPPLTAALMDSGLTEGFGVALVEGAPAWSALICLTASVSFCRVASSGALTVIPQMSPSKSTNITIPV